MSTSGEPASAAGLVPSLSADGRFVVFESSANNLVSGDTNGRVDPRDVFVRDRLRATTERVSVATDGAQGTDGESSHATISADGRYVAFMSRASDLVAHDTNRAPDVFVRDRVLHRTTRVSVRSDGHQIMGVSLEPAISADGRFVAFSSSGTNLAPGVQGQSIYVHDRRSGRTTPVGYSPRGEDHNPSISADGRVVTFERWQIPRRSLMATDRRTARTSRVDVSSGGRVANAWGYAPVVSANGRYIAFASSAGNLVLGDRNGGSDVFVRDLGRGTTTRASIRPDGTPVARCPRENDDGIIDVLACGDEPSISATGRFVLFTSESPQFDTTSARGGTGIFMRDMRLRTTVAVVNGEWGMLAISGDGRVAAFGDFSLDAGGLFLRGGLR